MTDSLADRVTRYPLPHDRDRATGVLEGLDPALRGGAWDDLLGGTAGSSPYLARLIERRAGWLARNAERSPEEILDRLLDRTEAAIRDSSAQSEVATHLRWAKPRAALVIALADLGGAWDVDAVTGALTRLADRLTAAATGWLLAQEVRSGKLPGMTEDELATGAGYVVLAMGKQGAEELNFSSDIDLICLFDQDRFDPSDFAEAKARYIRLTRNLVKLMSEQMGGYVFRTDLRLRPSPSTTPVAMAMEAAENYYESVGRTWERAAHIKARPVAGDLAAGKAYLERLIPFVWRRHLDFPAIEDTHEMLRKIRGKQGRFSPGDLPGADVKRDPGGIREIEFFAQTRQLVIGGRDPALREPRTVDALAALAKAGWVSPETAEQLGADYAEHRTLEHRLQMMEDAQTQTIPRQREARERVAFLSGTDDLDAFERGIGERMARVHALTEEFFTTKRRAPEGAGSRIDAAGLAERGFERPDDAAALLEGWRSGKIAATRSSRARRLFAGLEPKMVEELAAAASPDEAMVMLDRFLAGLPAGVQVFSLFAANPHLLDLIVDICATAPRLARHLGENSRALDALLDRDFFEPLGDADALAADLGHWLGDEDDYEHVLDLVRLWAREQTFRVGVQVLRALADREEAGAAFSDIAEATVRVLLPYVESEFARRHGPPPGRGMAVIALGKLGSREMTANSDLDLITVYDAGGAEESDGAKPLAPSAYFPRLTKALVAALTAPTAEGRLYEVDMRLRPSGRAGPVAVSIGAFDSYHREKAWVWEHMAMTRARVIAGEPSLAADIGDIITRAVRARAEEAGIRKAAAEMRARLLDAHKGDRGNIWSLKHAAGGLMEIEFLIQTGMLECGLADKPTARAALRALVEQGWLEEEEAETLRKGLGLMQRLQHMERVALEQPMDPATCGEGLRRAMTRAVDADTFENLGKWLAERQQGAAEIVEKRFP
ncbi:MAG TPA: bifunctional [glutamine synthetase] adenylyltransferase/[glutamine synthetase]-adenylyl-L-tyrosine phosphorylase [Thermohalobaculum sp.]|nr:bifunctional [glutamine synthetase] adenylyltransferase/[glutamine synthetase]-adenylyl-L-tyrosine phosphorylase [Thermohalobaculum sp.]